VVSLFARSCQFRRRLLLAGVAWVCLPLSATAQEQEIRIGGTGAALGALKLVAQAFAATRHGVRINVLPSLGSGGGIKALLAGALQIAVSSRELTPAEVSAGAAAVEYACTPFVFVTASTNPASSVTTQELVDAYAGNKSSWADGAKLRLVLRPNNDIDTQALKAMSPAMHEAMLAAGQRRGQLVAGTDQEAASSIATIPGALGTSTLSLILSEGTGLKALALDGVVPTVPAMASGAYPLRRRLYVVTGPATTSQAQAFVAFLRAPAGTEILHKTGHWVP
jgi:phosphate transport system substrate-binding protein